MDDIRTLDETLKPEFTARDVMFNNYMAKFPVVQPLLDSYNYFILRRTPEIVTGTGIRIGDNIVAWPKDVVVTNPTTTHNGVPIPLMLSVCRLEKMDYMCGIHIKLQLRTGSDTTDPKAGQLIDEMESHELLFHLPAMVGSVVCNSLVNGHDNAEDPRNHGGQYVMNGHDQFIPYCEMLRVDRFIFSTGEKKAKTVSITADTPRGTLLTELILADITIAPIKKCKVVQLSLTGMRIETDTVTSSIKAQNKSRAVHGVNIFKILRYYINQHGSLFDELFQGEADIIDQILDKVLVFIPAEQIESVITELSDSVVDAIQNPNEETRLNAIVAGKTNINNGREDPALYVVGNSMMPHINEPIDKVNNMIMMIAQMGQYMAGFRDVTKRDIWEEKRLQTSVKQVEQLFRSLWKTLVNTITLNYKDMSANKMRSDIKADTVMNSMISASKITKNFIASFRGPKWGSGTTSTKKNNPVQMLPHQSNLEKTSALCRTDVHVDRQATMLSVRSNQPDQLGYIDMGDTPDSSAVGVVKIKAITTMVTIPEDPEILLDLVFEKELIYDNRSKRRSSIFRVNSRYYGWCNHVETTSYLRQARRDGLFDRYTCICYDQKYDIVDVATNVDRLVRPLLTVNAEGFANIDTGKDDEYWYLDVEQLISLGYIEYIDVVEQVNCYIAPGLEELATWRQDLQEAKDEYEDIQIELDTALYDVEEAKDDKEIKRAKSVYKQVKAKIKNVQARIEFLEFNHYTHMDLHPQALFGPSLGTMRFMGNSQGPRATYQGQMAKQAMAMPDTNHANIFEVETKILNRPTLPMVTHASEAYLGEDVYPRGVTCTVAFAAYNGDSQEDAVQENERIAYGGHMDIAFYFKVEVDRKVGEQFERPKLKDSDDKSKYQFICQNGLPMLGALLNEGDFVVGKVYKRDGAENLNVSVQLKIGQYGIVDKIYVSNYESRVLISIRRDRSHIIGDKISSHYAQKNTKSETIKFYEMPFCEDDGSTPDILQNVHGVSSRMTIGYLYEPLVNLLMAVEGKRFNAGPFEKFDLQDIYRRLEAAGIKHRGFRWMRDPFTGMRTEARIFQGPVHIQVLHHLGLEKLQLRSTGRKSEITKQPTRGPNGGRRLGEMEKTGIAAHGAAHFLIECMVNTSDRYEVPVCTLCGNIADLILADTSARFKCIYCVPQDIKQFVRVVIPYIYKLIIQTIYGAGCQVIMTFAKKERIEDIYTAPDEDLEIEPEDDPEGIEHVDENDDEDGRRYDLEVEDDDNDGGDFGQNPYENDEYDLDEDN